MSAAYYPLTEPSGATSAANITRYTQGTAVVRQAGTGGTLEFGAGTGPGTDDASAPVFTPATTTTGLYLEATLHSPVGGGTGITLEGWLRTANTLIFSRRAFELRNAVGSFTALGVNASGHLVATGRRGGSPDAYTLTWTASVVSDALTHHVAVTESLAGGLVTVRLYVDGTERASTTMASTALPSYSRLLIGGSPKNPDGQGVWNGTLAHAAAHSAPLGPDRINAHYHAGTDGLAGERTDQRVARIADWVAIPAGDRALDAGDSTVGAQSTAGKQPIEAMREVERTENGVLFVDGAGRLTFHRRSRRYNQAPVFTLPASQVDPGAVFLGDDFGMMNDFTVTRPGGSPARAVNQASVDAHGLYRDEAEIIADTDVATSAAASWRVENYSEPRVRVPNVTVEVAKLEANDPSIVAAVLAATVGTKFRVSSLPASAPASTVDLFVEGWTEQIDVNTWQIVFNTSPGDFANVWQLGVAGYSELGVTTRLGL